MKLLLPCIFLILATFYTPGECIKCYICMTTTGERVKTDSVTTIKYCNMSGTNFDASSHNAEANAKYCVKAVFQVDSDTYTMRTANEDGDCNKFAKTAAPLILKKEVTDDQISFCGACSSDLCNSGNSLNSLQMAFSTFTMLSFLYFIS